MDVLTETAGLRDRLGTARCVLVPTMGALHEGHLSLVARGRDDARARGLPLAVSIFVNPAQFNDPADLRDYPRTLDADLGALREHGVDIAFVPDPEEVYPPDDPDAAPEPEVPPVGRLPGLEDRFRPGHFPGVCRVVSRLFDLCRPAAAVFGEKDWQQACVVASMCRQQGRDTEILLGATVREADGLAMSSRNTHLSPESRPKAAAIWQGFQAACRENTPEAAERVLVATMGSAGFEIEYATIRDAESLMPPAGEADRPLRVLAAGVLDGVRLLDNAPWPA